MLLCSKIMPLQKAWGQFILRIEDTDKTREVPGGVAAIQDIIRPMVWDWDEGQERR
jgi:glutamyl/glutaminyl-tRNA synthetase